MKNRYIAAVLAFILGVFGVHRFYLGQQWLGILYLTVSILGIMMETNNTVAFPPTAIVVIVAFVDAVLLLVRPKSEFDRQYNKVGAEVTETTSRHMKVPSRQRRVSSSAAAKNTTTSARNKAYQVQLKAGQSALQRFSLSDAKAHLGAALKEQSGDPEAAYLLAVINSLEECADDAYRYLALAFKNGFEDWDRLTSDEQLAWLRTQPDYPDRASRRFQQRPALPPPDASMTLLGQLEKLQHLRDQNLLTAEEFARQAGKLLKRS